MNEQQLEQNYPLSQQSKKEFKKNKLIRIIIWVILGIIIGIWSSNAHSINKNDDYCAIDNLGFPIRIQEWNYQYNDTPVTFFNSKLNIPTVNAVQVSPLLGGVMAECGWTNRQGEYKKTSGWSITMLYNIFIFVTFFIVVELFINNKYKYYLYLLNPLFVLILYLVFILNLGQL